MQEKRGSNDGTPGIRRNPPSLPGNDETGRETTRQLPEPLKNPTFGHFEASPLLETSIFSDFSIILIKWNPSPPPKALSLTEVGEGYNVPRGAAYLTSQQIIVYITYFAFYVILARVLTRAEIGQVSLLAATLAVFSTLTQLALPATATRYISSNLGTGQREVAGAVAKTILRLTLAIASVGTVVALFLSPVLGRIIFDSPDATVLLVTTF